MTKFHINKNGELKPCHASQRNCPCEYHFKTKAEGEAFIQKTEGRKYSYNLSRNLAKTLSTKDLTIAAKKNNEHYDGERTELYERKKKPPKKCDSIEEITKSCNEPDGGATIHAFKNVSPQSGFCVSPYKEAEVPVLGDVTESQVEKLIDSFRRDYGDKLKDDNAYVGLWRDPKTKVLYVDLSILVEDAREARILCEQNDQEAYYDLQTGKSINTK